MARKLHAAGLALALLTVLTSAVACSGQGYHAAPQVPPNLNFTPFPETTGGG
jgi:hypothetical protein